MGPYYRFLGQGVMVATLAITHFAVPQSPNHFLFYFAIALCVVLANLFGYLAGLWRGGYR